MGTISVRTDLRMEDLEAVVALHGTVYTNERGWNAEFASYVAGPLRAFFDAPGRGRMWIAETSGDLCGCIAIVDADAELAQLRWFLVAPQARGQGLGTRLLNEALAFARDQGFRRVMLWTEQSLTAAARLYAAAGFRRVEEKPGEMWGTRVVEERWELVVPNPSDE